MSKRPQILIVTDETLVGLRLSRIVEDSGGQVIGPCISLTDTIRALDVVWHVDAAILDFRLSDREATPLVNTLFDASVPIFMHTNPPAPSELIRRAQKITFCPKPPTSSQIWRAIKGLLDAPEVALHISQGDAQKLTSCRSWERTTQSPDRPRSYCFDGKVIGQKFSQAGKDCGLYKVHATTNRQSASGHGNQISRG